MRPATQESYGAPASCLDRARTGWMSLRDANSGSICLGAPLTSQVQSGTDVTSHNPHGRSLNS
jgi:hypothetical protein